MPLRGTFHNSAVCCAFISSIAGIRKVEKENRLADGLLPLSSYYRSDEIAWTALGSLALLALGEIFDLAVLEKGLHLDLAAAGAKKTLCSARCTRILRYSCHG
jgi:hypothetical protein